MNRRPARGDVWLISLDPTVGREIKKARPCLVVSPDELNRGLDTVLIAPMTTGSHAYPFRTSCRFQGKEGFVVLDQIRVADRTRLVKRLGALDPAMVGQALGVLREMFAE